MITRRGFLIAPVALCAVAWARRTSAEPAAGGPFPVFGARGLDDRDHTSVEWQGRRVFVCAITDTGAADAMTAWLGDAEARLGRARGNIYALVALDITFAWDGIVRSRAQAGTPRWRWPNVWLDRSGGLANAIGLPGGSHTPWAYVVESNGTISAATHASARDASAQSVWTAMMRT